MSRTRIIGLMVLVATLACTSLGWTKSAILVAERWEEPDTPRLAVLLKGQWTDGRSVDVERFRLKCTYFTGASLLRKIHVVDHDRQEGVFSCPSFTRYAPPPASAGR